MDDKVLRAILQLNQAEEVAVATIISTKGSTPRKAGAQVLFYRDGRTAGTIGGGCGEAEVRRQAFRVIETGKVTLMDVNLTHDIVEEDGMVCGGEMEVFIEPFKGKAVPVL
ncbi:MAG: XdhC family protein [Desulfitobacteriaceae bacterium]